LKNCHKLRFVEDFLVKFNRKSSKEYKVNLKYQILLMILYIRTILLPGLLMGLNHFINDLITEEDSYCYTLPQVLQHRAGHMPDHTAFIFLKDGEDDEDRISYRELDIAARDITGRLTERNFRGERAIILYPPGLDFIKAIFGCFYAGVVAVPAYPPRKNRTSERIRLMVSDAGAKIVLTNNDIYKTIERFFPETEELKHLTWLLPTEPNPTTPPLHHLTTSPLHHNHQI
jgi:acyl-CoA synthetase (AMP-forming)/AMP-acid ligase II